MKRFSVLLGLSLIVTSAVLPSAATASTRSGAILPSVISIDAAAHTAVLPLYHATSNGASVWYVITDASDADVAKRLHVVYAPSIGSVGEAATQHVTGSEGAYIFAGAPDFSKTRSYVASATGFPPKSAQPGAVADAQYSPFVTVDGLKGVLNAPIVATGDGPFDVVTHINTADRVVAIDQRSKTVTVVLARGFVNDKWVLYLSTEASDPVAASVERAVYVPKLSKASVGSQIPIGVLVDGPQGVKDAQGLAYLALRTPLGADATFTNASTIGSPFNVLSSIPDVTRLYSDNGYSPLWNVLVIGSSPSRLTNFAAFASRGPNPAGFSVNCPVVAFDTAEY